MEMNGESSNNRARARDNVNRSFEDVRSTSGGEVLARKHKNRKKRKRSASHSSSVDEREQSRQLNFQHEELADAEDGNPRSYSEHLGQLHRLDVQVRRRLTLGVKFLEGEYPNITISSLYDAPISQLLDDLAIAMEHLFEVVPWRCRIVLFRKFPRDQELFLIPQLPATMVGDYFKTNDLIHCRVRQTADKCPVDCPCKGGNLDQTLAIEDDDDDRSMVYDDGERVDNASASSSSTGRGNKKYVPRSAFLPNGARENNRKYVDEEGYESVDHLVNDRRNSGGNGRVRQRDTEVPKINGHIIGEEEGSSRKKNRTDELPESNGQGDRINEQDHGSDEDELPNARIVQLSPRDVARAHKHQHGRTTLAGAGDRAPLSQDVIHGDEYGLAATQPFDANDSEGSDVEQEESKDKSQHDVREHLQFEDASGVVQKDGETKLDPTTNRPLTPCMPAVRAATPVTPSDVSDNEADDVMDSGAVHTSQTKPGDTNMDVVPGTDTVRSPPLIPVEIGRAAGLGSPLSLSDVVPPVAPMPAKNDLVIHTDDDSGSDSDAMAVELDDGGDVRKEEPVVPANEDEDDAAVVAGVFAMHTVDSLSMSQSTQLVDEIVDANTSKETTPVPEGLASDEDSADGNRSTKEEEEKEEEETKDNNEDGKYVSVTKESVNEDMVSDDNDELVKKESPQPVMLASEEARPTDNNALAKDDPAVAANDNDSSPSSDNDSENDADDDSDNTAAAVATPSKTTDTSANDATTAQADDNDSPSDDDDDEDEDVVNDEEDVVNDEAKKDIEDESTSSKNEGGQSRSLVELVVSVLGPSLDDEDMDMGAWMGKIMEVVAVTSTEDEKHILYGRMTALMDAYDHSDESIHAEIESIVEIAKEEYVDVIRTETDGDEEKEVDTSQVNGSVDGSTAQRRHIDSTSESSSDSDIDSGKKTKAKVSTAPRRRRTTLGGEQTTPMQTSKSKSKYTPKSKLVNGEPLLPLPSPTQAPPPNRRRKSGLMGRRNQDQKTGTLARSMSVGTGSNARGVVTTGKPARGMPVSPPGGELSYPNLFATEKQPKSKSTKPTKSKSAKPSTRTKSQFAGTPVTKAAKRKSKKAMTARKRVKIG